MGHLGEQVGAITYKRTTVDTTGASITLNSRLQENMFIGSNAIVAPKTFVVNAGLGTNEFRMRLNLTAGVALTWPADFKMGPDPDWVAATNIWTTPLTGEYEAHGVYDGTNWYLTMTGLFN